MTFTELTTRVAQITAAVDLPVSVDIEAGYGLQPQQLIDGLVEVGAVGLNIEDTVHSEGGRLREAQEHADFVGGLRSAADAAGVHVVVNARTDLFLKQVGDEADRVERAIARLTLAAEAGPTCCTRWGSTATTCTGSSRRHCRCPSTQLPIRCAAVRPTSRPSASAGSASVRCCRPPWPCGRTNSSPAGSRAVARQRFSAYASRCATWSGSSEGRTFSRAAATSAAVTSAASTSRRIAASAASRSSAEQSAAE
ncbi:hypothetical protein GS495_23680 [Rhodococcus hoagii]|nr:hypothetical protein [Prescottella equi]